MRVTPLSLGWERCGANLLILAFCALALSPLLFAPIFAVDWANHVWFAAHVAHAIGEYWAVPTFLNTPALMGSPIFTFYGAALYAALTPFTVLFGPELGMRMAVALALGVPALATLRFFVKAGFGRAAAVCVTICLSVSVYQLTNVYTRGAVTEFLAYQLLLLGMVLLLTAAVRGSNGPNAWTIVFGAASVALSAMAHPPTLVLSGLFLTIPALVLSVEAGGPALAAFHTRRWLLLVLPTLFLPVAIWLFITLLNKSHLAISQLPAWSYFHYLSTSIDHWLFRLWPFPIDLRVLLDGYEQVTTPFLAAPINTVALTLFILAALRSSERRWAAPAIFAASIAVAIAAAILLSLPIGPVHPADVTGGPDTRGLVYAVPGSVIAAVFGPIQFAYRLVNIANLAVILGLLGLCVLQLRPVNASHRVAEIILIPRKILIVAAAISVAVTSAKVFDVYLEFRLLPQIAPQHWNATDLNSPGGNIRWTAPQTVAATRLTMRTPDVVPATQYGVRGYSMPALHPTYDAATAGRDEMAANFTMTSRFSGTLSVDCLRACALVTNLVASRFARLTIDGNAALTNQLATRPIVGTIVVLAEPGKHTIDFDLGSRTTTGLSWLILWLVVVFYVSALAVIVRSLSGTSRRTRA